MPVRTKAELVADLTTYIYDNDNEEITPAFVRTVLTNMLDSLLFETVPRWRGPWTGGDDYVIGDTVSRTGVIYVCKTANSDAAFTAAKWDRIGPDSTPDYSDLAGTPQYDLATNSTSLATPTTYTVRATSAAITPRSASSKFVINAVGIAGSISAGTGQNPGARGDCKFQRKIGNGSWTDVTGGEKNYAFLANYGNPPWSWGPIEDAPNTTDPVQYRVAIRRGTGNSHNGTWNNEFLALEVTEIV